MNITEHNVGETNVVEKRIVKNCLASKIVT